MAALRYVLVFLIYISWILSGGCQSITPAQRLVQEYQTKKNIPGVAFIIAKDGKVIDEGYFGKSNLELNTPVTETSVFAIASMSKTYTAAAILMMREKGMLSLDDQVTQYIPEAPDTWKKITVNHLLTHTSGLPDDWGLFDWETSIRYFISTQSDSAFLSQLFKTKLLFEPGTDQQYSCGPFVLGIIIERITGKPYGQYLEENIFKPLGLTRTFVDDPYRIIEGRVDGYLIYDSATMGTRFSGTGNGLLISPVSYGRADVGIRTTAGDAMKFYLALLNGQLINDQSRSMMFNPSMLENGARVISGPGWMNWPLHGRMISQHGGAFRTGFSSQVVIFHDDNLVIVLLTNKHGGSDLRFVQEMAALYNPIYEKISEKSGSKDKSPLLTAQHLSFLKKYGDGYIDESVTTDQFDKKMMSRTLRSVMNDVNSIQFITEEKRETKILNHDVSRVRYYRLTGSESFYTAIYQDRNNSVVFVEYPEFE